MVTTKRQLNLKIDNILQTIIIPLTNRFQKFGFLIGTLTVIKYANTITKKKHIFTKM